VVALVVVVVVVIVVTVVVITVLGVVVFHSIIIIDIMVEGVVVSIVCVYLLLYWGSDSSCWRPNVGLLWSGLPCVVCCLLVLVLVLCSCWLCLVWDVADLRWHVHVWLR